MKDWREVALIVTAILCLAAVSCQSLIDRVTPAEIPEQVAEYLELDPNTVGLSTLHRLKQLEMKIAIKHRDVNLELLRLTEDNQWAYEDARFAAQVCVLDAKEFQSWIVGGEDQEFSLLNVLFGGTVAAAIFNKVKRKGDFTPAEVQTKIAQAEKETRDKNG